MSEPTGTEIVLRGTAPIEDMKTAIALFDSGRGALESLAVQGVSVERVRVGYLYAIQHNPGILQCTQSSVIRSVGQTIALGLTLGGWRPEAHIVPFFNKKKRRKEAQLIPDYKGLVALMRRRGGVVHVNAGVVYENDLFEYDLGSSPWVKHVPVLKGDRGDYYAVWASVTVATGHVHIAVMRKEEVEKIRRSAQSDSVWKEWEDEQRKKTALRRISKLLDLTDPLIGHAMSLSDAEYPPIGRRPLEDTAHDTNVALGLVSDESSEVDDELEVEEAPEGADDPYSGLGSEGGLFGVPPIARYPRE